MLASRFECKYYIPLPVADMIRDYISPFVSLDAYSAARPRRRYPICSLYLDDSNLTLHEATMQGRRNRFKLRIRHYSDRPEAPVFLEIKRRIDGTIRKQRARVSRSDAIGLISGEMRSADLFTGEDLEAADNFLVLSRRIDAHPILKVKYEREAYDAVGEPVRITFDWNVSHALTQSYDLAMHDGTWQGTPTDGLIMEIKFTDRMPAWVHRLVQSFGLKRRSIPKYVLSVLHAGSAEENRAGLAERMTRTREF